MYTMMTNSEMTLMETIYVLQSPKNAERLLASIRQLQ